MNFDEIKSQLIRFHVHDKEVCVSPDSFGPETSLNEYLREKMHLTGTKVMCREGGCGVCIVSVTAIDPITKQELHFAVNSCLVSIYSCSGWKIHTSEGIGGIANGYHPLQKRLAEKNGTQCGFCSSGMVMNMYPLYLRGNLTAKEVENSFASNICRCTGYRTILDAFKSMTVNGADGPATSGYYPDIEDLHICPTTGQSCFNTCDEPCPKSVQLKAGDSKWFKVNTIAEITQILNANQNQDYILVAGNTAQGVYQRTEPFKIYISVTGVPELISYTLTANSLVLGGNMTLTNLMQLFYKLGAENSSYSYLTLMADHLDLVAHIPVRNIGTIAGNLMIKHQHNEFPSDVFLLLETAGAIIDIVGKAGVVVKMQLVDFLDFDMDRKIIKSITLSPLNNNVKFQSYKIMPRAQNAHAHVNAGFLYTLAADMKKVTSARIVFGGINPNFVHAKGTEAFLAGKELFNNDTIQGAIAKLKDELKPDYVLPDLTPEFRKGLAISLFYKGLLSLAPENVVSSANVSSRDKLEKLRPVTSATQVYETKPNLYPITEPISKLEALTQCAGEAEYIIDKPDRPNQLYAAFVLAKASAGSKIKSTDTTAALKVPGVVKYYDQAAIPGVNSISPKESNLDHDEELFCSGTVLYYYQPVGIIVATAQKIAEKGASLVNITYEKSTKKPLLTSREILAANAKEKIHEDLTIPATRRGNDVVHTVKGTFDIHGQYHYTMETQCCNVVPTEDGLDIFPASQWVDLVQIAAAACLAIHNNRITVKVRRLGGAYGSKISRNIFASCAAAIAANDLRRPVKLWTPLQINMNSIGKRFPCSMDYEVGLNKNGVIQYLKNTFWVDYGAQGGNESVIPLAMDLFSGGYIHDTFDLSAFTTRADIATGTWTRAPGTTEGLAMIESILEHAAVQTGLDQYQLRMVNLDKQKHPLLNNLMEDMKKWANLDKRKADVDVFNKANRWMKKGISVVPMNYAMLFFGPFPVYVVIYQGDGTVTVQHSGIEMGQGVNTKVAQVVAKTLGRPLNEVTVKPTDNVIGGNATISGGSLTSEACCLAALKACTELKANMDAVEAELKKTVPNPTWIQIVKTAYATGVPLFAAYNFTPKDMPDYSIYGVAAAEVLVDILTGNHQVVRLDLIEDTGETLSPLIDIGQIEGAFMMGLGYYTTEQLILDPEDGKLTTNRTWTYKPPGIKDIPVEFNVKLPANVPNTVNILHSKALAEPPLCMSVVVPLAMRQAIASARTDADQSQPKWFKMGGPTTVENVFLNSLHRTEQYKL